MPIPNAMKKTGIIAALLLLLLGAVACKKDKNPGSGIFGEWMLVSYPGSDSDGAAKIDVYLNFRDDGSFELFQKIGGGHYSSLTGTFSFDGGILSGSYSNGSPWGGTYDVIISDDSMVMTDRDVIAPGEYAYTKTSIPDAVRKDAEDFGTVKSTAMTTETVSVL